jgi:DNA-binding NarL/FixJ family response regulator
MQEPTKEIMVTAKKKKAGKEDEKPFNENWEAEIAEYDKECSAHDVEYLKTHIVIDEAGSKKLDEAENEILVLYLNGSSCKEIADKYELDEQVVTEMIAVIKAKLSMGD